MEAVASYGWRQDRSVEDGLFTEGHAFTFLQAVHLLELMYRDAKRSFPAEGIEPRHELVRFSHEVRLDFPPGDVEWVRRSNVPDEPPVEMRVNVLGLAGANAPLPQRIAEQILRRDFRGDDALRKFLDLFNHRLISLLYRAKKKYRPALDLHAPDGGRVANVLYALLGLGTAHLKGRMALRDRSLLPYAGLVVDSSRSTIGLVRILEDCFATKVEVIPFRGKWEDLDSSDWSRLGATRGRNQRLGDGAVLGRRVWNATAAFEVRLGPLTLAQFRSFLPEGHAYIALVSAIRFYAHEELGFRVRLTLAAAEVPPLRLGKRSSAYLGYTTWIRSRPFTADDSQVSLTGKA